MWHHEGDPGRGKKKRILVEKTVEIYQQQNVYCFINRNVLSVS